MTHIHEKIDFTVSVFIVHKNKVLLRFHNKYKTWFDIGGHIEADEGPIEALHREAKEEAGLEIKIIARPTVNFTDVEMDIQDLPAPAFLNRHRISPSHEHIDLLYIATSDTDQVSPEDSEENKGAELKWMSVEELTDPKNEVIPRVQYYASEAIKIVQQHDR